MRELLMLMHIYYDSFALYGIAKSIKNRAKSTIAKFILFTWELEDYFDLTKLF